MSGRCPEEMASDDAAKLGEQIYCLVCLIKQDGKRQRQLECREALSEGRQPAQNNPTRQPGHPPHLQRNVLGAHNRAFQALQCIVLLLHDLLLHRQQPAVAQLGGGLSLTAARPRRRHRPAAAACAGATQQRVTGRARRLPLQGRQHLLTLAAQHRHQVAPPVPLVLGAALKGRHDHGSNAGPGNMGGGA